MKLKNVASLLLAAFITSLVFLTCLPLPAKDPETGQFFRDIPSGAIVEGSWKYGGLQAPTRKLPFAERIVTQRGIVDINNYPKYYLPETVTPTEASSCKNIFM